MVVIGHTVTRRARRRVLVNPISRVCLECLNLIRMFEHRFDPLETGNVASSYVSSNVFQVAQNQHLVIFAAGRPMWHGKVMKTHCHKYGSVSQP